MYFNFFEVCLSTFPRLNVFFLFFFFFVLFSFFVFFFAFFYVAHLERYK